MTMGWAKDDAVNEQIEDSINDEIRRVRYMINNHHTSLKFCIECGQRIPDARRRVVPGVMMCIECQQIADVEQKRFQLYNRRGNLDSQIR